MSAFGTATSAFAPAASSTFTAPTFQFPSTTSAFPTATTTSAFPQSTFNFAAKPTVAPTLSAFAPATSTIVPTQFSFGSTMAAFAPTTSTTIGLAGVPVQQPPPSIEKLHAAVTCPHVYGDERDVILAKLNQVLAYWGTGKGYFSPNDPAVEFTEENPFCRFKFVAYSCVATAKPESGLFSMVFNKPMKEFELQRQQVLDQLFRIFGSKPNLSICVHLVKMYNEKQTELIIYVTEKSPAGTSRNLLPSELLAYFGQQPAVKQQLTALGVTNMFSKTALPKDVLKFHLDNPPMGIDPYIWRQGVLDNPDSEKFIPVPVVGFSGLRQRMLCQQQEAQEQNIRLGIITKDIQELTQKQLSTISLIAERKRKLSELQHRVLKMMCKLEIKRKMGLGMQIEEEQLRIKLESMASELDAPNAFRGRLREITSNIRMLNCAGGTDFESYSIDDDVKNMIKEHLRVQQQGITHLVDFVKDDLKDLKIIEKILKEPNQ